MNMPMNVLDKKIKHLYDPYLTFDSFILISILLQVFDLTLLHVGIIGYGSWTRSTHSIALEGRRLKGKSQENQVYLNQYIIENHKTIPIYTSFVCYNKRISQFTSEGAAYASPEAKMHSCFIKHYQGWTREECERATRNI